MFDSPDEGFVSKTNVERLTSGFFAFTMTLLVRTLPQVKIPAGMTGDAILNFIQGVSNGVLTYVAAFLVLGLFWLLIFRIYRTIGVITRGVIYAALAFLLFLVFVPYALEIETLNPNLAQSIIPFHLNILLLGCLVIVLYYVTDRLRIRDDPVVRATRAWQFKAKLFLIPVLSALGAVAAYANIIETSFIYFIGVPAAFLVLKESL